ncbi:ribosome-associated protein [Chitinasiproducens palmae]|uniref:Dual-action ribosomal maturation protein DarP n=1 Tax=Chitinasiproducens palmae TaxID=1770053 RepID=A0A1H2PVL3_9BURK|nr:ribosome-associated protein [Chitinasiproducens palmae]
MSRRSHFPDDAAPSDDLSDDGYGRPSKSQRKRDMHALQEIGDAIAALPKDALKRVPMPEALYDAIREARRITDHEGRRRQMQYVGRVMRTLEQQEVAALQAALAAIRGDSRAETAKLHAVERWRERLLADDAAMTEFLAAHPQADSQQGRTLVRNARREAAAGKPPRYFREIFQWVKAAIDAGNAGATADDGADAFDDDDDDNGAAWTGGRAPTGAARAADATDEVDEADEDDARDAAARLRALRGQ